MSKKHYTQDGAGDEPAFPVTSAAEHQFCGMSLREYFAAKAMQAFCTGAEGMGGLSKSERSDQFNVLADFCYEVADAMLKARSQS